VALSKRAGGVDLVTSHVVREVLERGLDSWSASQAGSSGGLITVTDRIAVGKSLDHLDLSRPETAKPPPPVREILRVAGHGDGWGVPADWE
jgi:hypothetical protein